MWHRFLSDWTVAPIVEISSGRPFNILAVGDANGDFQSTNERPTVLADGTLCQTGVDPNCLTGVFPANGNLGRNAGTKPYNLFTDLGVAKDIQIGERVSLQARMDVFNFINRFNVADVNPLWDSGQKATAAFDPRQLQFALKLKW